MIKIKNYAGNEIELKVVIGRYPLGGQLYISLMMENEDGEEELYDVVTRNIPEFKPMLSENQTFIPIKEYKSGNETTRALLEQGVLQETPFDIPYNYYRMAIYDVCLDKADEIVSE